MFPAYSNNVSATSSVIKHFFKSHKITPLLGVCEAQTPSARFSYLVVFTITLFQQSGKGLVNVPYVIIYNIKK